MIRIKTRHAVCRIKSKVYTALLKRFTIRLKRSEKSGFPMIGRGKFRIFMYAAKTKMLISSHDAVHKYILLNNSLARMDKDGILFEQIILRI